MESSEPKKPPDLCPALVVVDHRNTYHQAESVLGHRARPDVAGVMRAAALYGFDARRVCVGIALPRPRDREELAEHYETNRRYRDTVLAHQFGDVLAGELHLNDGKVVEKIVDVACAVEITREVMNISRGESPVEAVLVMSRDIDLSPAYDVAAELNVPLYVAASETVDKRQHPYLLLTERALSYACPTGAKLEGHRLRDAVARAAKERKIGEWRFIRTDGERQGLVFEHVESGVLGVIEGRKVRRLEEGQTIELYPADVDFGRHGLSFPIVALSTDKPRGTTDIRTGVVTKRLHHDIKVQLRSGDTVSVHAEAGHLVRGTEVALQVRDKTRLIGALQDPPPLLFPDSGEIVDTGQPMIVTVLNPMSEGAAIAADGKGRRLTLLYRHNLDVRAGERFVALAIDVKAGKKQRLIAVAISSRLPQ